MTKFVTIIGKGVGWFAEVLGDGILEYLSIPETAWDTDSDEYFFQKDTLIDLLSISPQTLLRIEQSLLPKGKNPVLDNLSAVFTGESFMKISGALEGFIEQYNGFVRKKVEEIIALATVADTVYPISETFAFLCGLWNGLVDFIGGTLKFIGHLLQMPYDIFDDIDSALETFDNICQGIRNLWNNIGDVFSQMYDTFSEYLKKQDSSEINPDKVAYITGFGVAFVASLFVPVAQLTRVASFSKVGKSMLPASFLDDITKGIGKGVDYLKDTSRSAAKAARKGIDEMVALMMLGADKFRKMIKDLIEKIFAWFRKNSDKLKSAYDDALLEGWKVLAKYFKTEKIIKATNGVEILCFGFNKGLVPVDKILMYVRGKVRGVENLANLQKELAELKYLRQTARKAFEKDSKNAERLEELDKVLVKNAKKALQRKEHLEKMGFPDTEANNKKLFELILADLNKQYKKIGAKPNNFIRTSLKTSKGKIILETKWIIRPEDGKYYMTTILVK